MANTIDVNLEEHGGAEWTREAIALMDGNDATSLYARQAGDMRAALKEEAGRSARQGVWPAGSPVSSAT